MKRIFLDCSNPQTLGVATRGTFPDSQIHASSYNDAMLSPRWARLSPPANCIGWRVASGDTERWIQVDFLRSTKVTAILTQGIYLFILFLFNNFIGAINYFKIISTISTGPKGKGANEAI